MVGFGNAHFWSNALKGCKNDSLPHAGWHAKVMELSKNHYYYMQTSPKSRAGVNTTALVSLQNQKLRVILDSLSQEPCMNCVRIESLCGTSRIHRSSNIAATSTRKGRVLC
jgi:hypothetical protein